MTPSGRQHAIDACHRTTGSSRIGDAARRPAARGWEAVVRWRAPPSWARSVADFAIAEFIARKQSAGSSEQRQPGVCNLAAQAIAATTAPSSVSRCTSDSRFPGPPGWKAHPRSSSRTENTFSKTRIPGDASRRRVPAVMPPAMTLPTSPCDSRTPSARVSSSSNSRLAMVIFFAASCRSPMPASGRQFAFACQHRKAGSPRIGVRR
jgi:hypothetical protein